MQYETFAILGATGQQGGAVVRHLAKTYPNAKIHAITRSPEKPNAQALLSLGPNVSLVQASFADRQSLVEAFSGAEVIFLVTDYWNTQNNAVSANLNTEITDGMAAIEVAAGTKSLKHFVFGTLLDFAPLSDMKWRNMYHFNTKAVLNHYIRAKPDLWAKTTLIFSPIYYENYLTFDQKFYPMLGGPRKVGDEYVAWYPNGGTLNLSYLSIEDLGKVFGAVIEKPQSYFQKMAIIVGEFFSAQDLIGQWADVVGVKARIETLSSKEFIDRVGQLGGPEFMALEIYEQMRCLEELGDLRKFQTEIPIVDMSKVVELTSWKQWIAAQDWTEFFRFVSK
ncbi:hypothetical protein M431DRAFT_96011 [Trichoderma harzianum CBS 226.95]|uniref:NmrA-like domain-containing protein n=1 Tax=Trichoderma harzianum CBS 226.95 TaxID=983964 RepID=A0A2T3ZZ12_TRIHA|nr:hypothetical protein M431DRAFT_96011 [Trichoderma harzianum CBS 226.95]PTB50056.1 hypothetical protein M431DRAFT_96011 [Trichoderma harzianum CBS 226.95]